MGPGFAFHVKPNIIDFFLSLREKFLCLNLTKLPLHLKALRITYRSYGKLHESQNAIRAMIFDDLG